MKEEDALALHKIIESNRRSFTESRIDIFKRMDKEMSEQQAQPNLPTPAKENRIATRGKLSIHAFSRQVINQVIPKIEAKIGQKLTRVKTMGKTRKIFSTKDDRAFVIAGARKNKDRDFYLFSVPEFASTHAIILITEKPEKKTYTFVLPMSVFNKILDNLSKTRKKIGGKHIFSYFLSLIEDEEKWYILLNDGGKFCIAGDPERLDTLENYGLLVE